MEVLVQWVLMLLAILGLVQLGEMICLWSRLPEKKTCQLFGAACVRQIERPADSFGLF